MKEAREAVNCACPSPNAHVEACVRARIEQALRADRGLLLSALDGVHFPGCPDAETVKGALIETVRAEWKARPPAWMNAQLSSGTLGMFAQEGD